MASIPKTAGLSRCCNELLYVAPSTGDIVCGACGKLYTTADLLNSTGIPTKPKPPKPLSVDVHAGKLSPCCHADYAKQAKFAHDEFRCVNCSRVYTQQQVIDYSYSPGYSYSRGRVTPSTFNSAGAVSTGSPWGANPTIPKPPKGGDRRPLTGKTYEVREQLKKLGGYWDPEARVWLIPERRYDEAVAIVAKGPDPSTVPGNQTRPFVGVDWGKPDPQVETRACWECNVSFTKAQVKKTGSWAQYWCGCTEHTPKVLPATTAHTYEAINVYNAAGGPSVPVCRWCGQDFFDHDVDGTCLSPPNPLHVR